MDLVGEIQTSRSPNGIVKRINEISLEIQGYIGSDSMLVYARMVVGSIAFFGVIVSFFTIFDDLFSRTFVGQKNDIQTE